MHIANYRKKNLPITANATETNSSVDDY